ncbi:MAG TPA: M20/M25/M40 family metallo-hydrolase [Candidatus Krumholzibacteriaceae bacterium]|nr:M20/M25/M40 family metallo-hydrolase [Candidatus Krumholzibacteriaceae bacterium]
MESLKQLLFSLVEVGSPSGFEEPMMRRLVQELKPLCDEVYDTPRGNVVGVQRGTDPEAPGIALAAHTDQVGFVVFNVDERGFIWFRRVGGAVTRSIQGHQVRLLTEEGPIIGVVGIKPGHITKPEEASKVPPIEEMYIDIGANSREEAHRRGVEIGTPIVWNTGPVELGNNYIATPAADDRAGLAAIITIARNLSHKPIPATVYYVGTVEEEIGLRGAEVAVHGLDLDMAVAIDTCPAGYQPDVNMRDLYYEVGKGPAIHIGELGSRTRLGSQVLRRWLIGVAEMNGIPYQTGLMHGGTDASAMQQTKAGLAACTIGVPRRYSHSPVEVLSLEDLHNLTEIMTRAIEGLTKDFSTHRI